MSFSSSADHVNPSGKRRDGGIVFDCLPRIGKDSRTASPFSLQEAPVCEVLAVVGERRQTFANAIWTDWNWFGLQCFR